MAKQRISLTLDEDLLEKIDAEVDRKDLNRSQMMDQVVSEYLSSQGLDTAVVFCGGEEAKSMQVYDGKPVLSHVLDHLSSEGIDRIVLLVGPNKDEIEGHFGSEYRGSALEYMEEQEPEGTASALEKVKEKIGKTFVAVNGHVVTDVDLQDMLKVHRDEGNVATMALTTVENPSDYGVVKLKGRTILGFERKPDPGREPSRLINAGTYIFEPAIFSKLGPESLETVFEHLSSDKQLSGYIYGGKWQDIKENW
ncbi:MAG: sugar phosphate nucleotidyltransferase [Candidatus Nanohalobium sp.]